MKMAGKGITVCILGLLGAGALYPFSHELGHTIFTLLIGGTVTDFSLFPVAHIQCQLQSLHPFAVAVIGLGGSLFPFLLTLFPSPKGFYFWYVLLVLKLCCLISFMISLVALFLFPFGILIPQEDITPLMQYAPQWHLGYCFVLLGLFLITVIQIKKSAPLKRCAAYFDVI